MHAEVALVVVEPGGVPEALGEGVRVDLELGDELVLVGGDGREDSLGEDEGVDVLVLEIGDGAAGHGITASD